MRAIRTILKNKFILFLLFIVFAVGGYWGYRVLYTKKKPVEYVTSEVTKGTLTVSVSGSGQVSSSNQVDVKSRVSGTLLRLYVKNGQEIAPATALAFLDSGDALKAVRDAQLNLKSARLSLQKLQQPPDALTLLQSENSVIATKDSIEKLTLSQQTEYDQAQETKQKSSDSITKSYEDGYNSVANAFLDIPTVMSKLDDILYSSEIGASEVSVGKSFGNISALLNTTNQLDRDGFLGFQNSAEEDYAKAETVYNQAIQHYKSSTRYDDPSAIEALLAETLEATKSVAQAAKSETNFLDAWVGFRKSRGLETFTKVSEYQTNLSSYISKTNSHISALLSIQRTLQDAKELLKNAERTLVEMKQNNPKDLVALKATLQEKQGALEKLKAGTDEVDIESQKLIIAQREINLADAQAKLADYSIKTPIGGIIASIPVKIADTISAGTSIATVVTKQKLADISLNEVDVAKVKVGQKTTITFDAVEGLSLTGNVVQIDTLGVVSQGVVSYNAQIGFDIQDDRIKPGMSVSIAIITDVRQGVILVPNSAVKTNNGQGAYVEILRNTAVESIPVQVGLANDTMTEVSGSLQEGDRVITQVVDPNTQQTQQQRTNTGFPGLGGGLGGGARGGGSGGAIRIPR